MKKSLLNLLHPDLEGVTEVDTNPKQRFVSFKVTRLMTEVFVFIHLQSIIPGNSWLVGGKDIFIEGLQNCMENKSEGNKSKIKLGDFNCTMDKMDRYGRNKTQRIYRYGSNYVLSKLVLDNGLKDL